jgi:hypothetical protein
VIGGGGLNVLRQWHSVLRRCDLIGHPSGLMAVLRLLPTLRLLGGFVDKIAGKIYN